MKLFKLMNAFAFAAALGAAAGASERPSSWAEMVRSAVEVADEAKVNASRLSCEGIEGVLSARDYARLDSAQSQVRSSVEYLRMSADSVSHIPDHLAGAATIRGLILIYRAEVVSAVKARMRQCGVSGPADNGVEK